jgi:hypothetical protein
LEEAFGRICRREVTHLVDQAMLDCHSEEVMREILAKPPQLPNELQHPDRRELDDCVLELIGVTDTKKREKLLDELYLETTKYYRYQRTQDIQAMEDRAGNHGRRLSAQDLAESIWHSLAEEERGPALPEWIKSTFRNTEPVEIPEGAPHAHGASDMFHPNAVAFRAGKDTCQVDYKSPEQAALVAELGRFGIHGRVNVPRTVADCTNCLVQIESRLAKAKVFFTELAASRTGTQSLQEKTVALLLHWYTHGKNTG